MVEDFLHDFIFFFAVIDPIGTVPVYLAICGGLDPKQSKQIALKGAFYAFLILIFFVVVGEFILDGLGIPLNAFQIAGGIVLFLFALTMIFGETKPEEEIKMMDNNSGKAVFPLAVPSLASPGAMLGAVLLTKNDERSFLEQIETTIAMVLVIFIALVLMLGANRIQKLIGESGAGLISRVMGLILASAAVSNILEGISSYFSIGQ